MVSIIKFLFVGLCVCVCVCHLFTKLLLSLLFLLILYIIPFWNPYNLRRIKLVRLQVTVWKYRTNTVTEWSNTVTEKPLCFEVFPKKDTIMSVTYYLKQWNNIFSSLFTTRMTISQGDLYGHLDTLNYIICPLFQILQAEPGQCNNSESEEIMEEEEEEYSAIREGTELHFLIITILCLK